MNQPTLAALAEFGMNEIVKATEQQKIESKPDAVAPSNEPAKNTEGS